MARIVSRRWQRYNEANLHYWHTTPLHYLPTLLPSGRILSADALQREQFHVVPRPSALARKRALDLGDFVHLSLKPITPLLIDKHQKGFPHALLRFSGTLAEEPGSAYLKWNTKKWTHRDEFTPITGPDEKEAFLREWEQGKYPSAELLIPSSLDLTFADSFFLPSETYASYFPTFTVAPELFPSLAPCSYQSELDAYLLLCRHLPEPPPPPGFPFD